MRDDGGRWSNWVEQEDGTPIYVGGADQAQVRAPFRPRGRLHFVNVSGTAGQLRGPAAQLRAARDQHGLHLGRVDPGRAGDRPEAGDRQPRRAGAPTSRAAAARRGAPPEYGTVQAAVIHHTVNANDYTPEEAPSIVLGICRFHVYGNGWNDIGYNALVDRFGTLYEGRAGGLKRPVVGAQAQGFNSQTTSIASIGDHTERGSDAAGAALDHPVPRLEDGGEPRLPGDRHRPADLGRRARRAATRRARWSRCRGSSATPRSA